MKRAIGSLLCIFAILRIISLLAGAKAESGAHLIQDWAVVGVLLAIGVKLSSAKTKSDEAG
jgi:hypothetical protein